MYMATVLEQGVATPEEAREAAEQCWELMEIFEEVAHAERVAGQEGHEVSDAEGR